MKAVWRAAGDGTRGGIRICPVHNRLDKIQLKVEIFLCKSKGAEKDTSFF
jgi:hypothetical protein